MNTSHPTTKLVLVSLIVVLLGTLCLLPSSTGFPIARGTQIPVPITGESQTPVAALGQGTAVYLPAVTAGAGEASSENLGAGMIYYVSTKGNDSNPGTKTSPFRTIKKGASILKAGDTLYILSGTYVQDAPIKISASGSSPDNPVTVTTAPGEPSQAVISGDTNGDQTADVPAQGSWNGLVELRGSYIRFTNLEVAYSGGRGIMSTGKGNVISSNRVHHIWRSGINVVGPNNLVEKNTVWRTVDLNWCGGATGRKCNGNWDGGIAWGEPHDASAPGSAPNIIIRSNIVYNTSGEGVLCMHTDGGLVENNVVYDNWALNIDLDQCSFTTVQKNLVYYSGDKVWWRSATRPGVGIMLSNEGIRDSAGNTYPIGHDRRIVDNIMAGNGSNFYFWTGDGGLTNSALVNDLIAFNTLVNTAGSGGVGLRIDAGPHANTRILDNVILQASGTITSVGSQAGLSFSHNLWSKSPTAAALSPSDVTADPQLVDPNHPRDPGAVSADWYKLKSSSPALGKAAGLSEVAIDFWGTPRGSRPDLGAHELP